MIKPMGVLLVLGVVLALILCLVPVLWGIAHCIRNRAWKTAVVLGIAAVGIVVSSAWAVYAVAPKGSRTIAQLELSNGRMFTVRHYRFGWLEYPKARFYARDTKGLWTSFEVISELVNPNAASLVLDASAQEVQLTGVGWYRIEDNDFVNIDGSRGNTWQLPPTIEPGEEDIYGASLQSPQ